MPNFNADDPNNPLLGLLAGRSLHGTAGWMPFGAADTMNLTGTNYDPASYRDPRYWEQYTEWDGDNGQRAGWRPRADVMQQLGGREQLANTNIGGPREVMDPSQVQYDPTFGLLTQSENIRPDPVRQRQIMTGLAAIMAPAAVGAIGAMSGLGATGSAAPALTAEGATGVGTVAGAGTVGGTVAPAAGITGGTGAFNWANATGAAANGATGATGATGAEASTGLTGNSTIDGLLGQAAANPLRTFGLLQSIYGMIGGGSSGSPSGNSNGSKGGTGSPVGTGPMASRAAYQPNPITAMQLQNMRYARPRGI